ncbi:LacI family transcriptional regulator [Actinoplanes lobatus]|uniref:LacI family transcriptional regulator n=1 Tax=Actinoplanes lobatus TaxID=113568 RepID=A0A7W7HL29_9ACTN|nr:LacI family DNA-binding transcriptional regulator [Actinoplanes lobatus]MBB4752471.1 LacI family transcriptional regulator [Actinoplanes lobatus]GGN99495.1 LacI family transcriptional regulator [Actinoplanes lobatus]GIE46305.1 LacI family transcriptional regulator [Actinoplanes lobatus]
MPHHAEEIAAAVTTRATLRDVAMLAGVSPKTASRVVNGETGVSPAKVNAVQRAVAQLNYRPNFTASALRRSTGRTAAIGAVLENVANPFSSALHRALEDVARSRDVMIFAGSVDEDPAREKILVQAFTARQADALVVVPASDNQAYLAHEIAAGTPVIFVDRPPVGVLADAVLADNRAGAAAAVHHLVAHGHRDIGYLGDLSTIATAAERLQGYKEALSDHGIRPQPDHIVHDLHTEDAARAAALRLTTGRRPPTAYFTAQNLVTIGAIRALRELHQHERIALVGFDDFPLADLLQPAVTVVAQDPFRMGLVAAELIFRRLDGQRWEPTTHVVPTRLIPRGSGEITGPYPRQS